MKELKAFTVKAHWGLLIRSGLKTCENRSFRVSPGFYLVHASGSLSFSEWRAGFDWVSERFGTAVICPSFDLCRSWCGQIVCGITVVSALKESSDPWYLGDVAWELERPVPFEQGVRVKGQLGVWKIGAELRKRFRDGLRQRQQAP
ncbi:MAG: hypothetical protein PHX41_00505 [Kiritimatiellae bacterium]|nr:hypothetical protein [Kiritimatiellia bacterium]